MWIVFQSSNYVNTRKSGGLRHQQYAMRARLLLVSSEVLSLPLAERVRGNDGAWSIEVIPIGWPVNVSVHSAVVAR